MVGTWDDQNDNLQNGDNRSLEQQALMMFKEVTEELNKVHTQKYDEKQAVKTAALALRAQMIIAEFLSDVEASAKGAKNNIKAVEAEIYFDVKKNAKTDKKPSEAALQQMVANDDRSTEADEKAVDAEKKAKKWAYVFNTLKDAHIFFRNLGKNDWSV